MLIFCHVILRAVIATLHGRKANFSFSSTCCNELHLSWLYSEGLQCSWWNVHAYQNFSSVIFSYDLLFTFNRLVSFSTKRIVGRYFCGSRMYDYFARCPVWV